MVCKAGAYEKSTFLRRHFPVDYATIASRPDVGYSFVDVTDPSVFTPDMLSLALPSGSNWLEVSLHRCVKVSRVGRRRVLVSVARVYPDSDEFGRKGLVYANVIVLRKRDWLARLRSVPNTRDMLIELFRDFPYRDNRIADMLQDWHTRPTPARYSQALRRKQLLRILVRRKRVLIEETPSEPEEWEGYADHVFKLARMAAGIPMFPCLISFTTLTLSTGEDSQVAIVART